MEIIGLRDPKRRLRAHIVVLVSAFLGRNISYANDLWDFIQVAKTRDATLQAASFQRDVSVEIRPQALAQLLPQLSASASVARESLLFQSTQLSGNEGVSCALNSDSRTERCFGNVIGLGLTLSQTLWDTQAFYRLKEANFEMAAAELTLRSAQQSLLLRVAQAYFAVLSASDQLDTNRRERQTFETLLNQAKSREKAGSGALSDVEQVQAFYDATENGIIDAENALDDANLALTVIVGEHSQTLSLMRDEIPLVSPEPAAVEEWVRSARQGNFDVLAAQMKADAAAREVQSQTGRRFPTLSLIGSSSKFQQDAILGGNQTIDTIGVYFNWPLFQGGAVSSAIRQSRAASKQALAAYDSTQRDTERQTRSSFRGVMNGIRSILAAQRAMESGRVSVQASSSKVDFGTGTEFDLLNAQNNYYAAVRTYKQARYDYLVNSLMLKQQAGQLSDRDIQAVDNLLVEHSK